MVNHHPANSGVHRHCGSGDMMFFVVEVQDSTCPRFSPPLLFIFKGLCLRTHGTAYHINNSDPVHTR